MEVEAIWTAVSDQLDPVPLEEELNGDEENFDVHRGTRRGPGRRLPGRPRRAPLEYPGDDEIKPQLCDPPSEREGTWREMPLRVPRADPEEPRGPDGRDGLRCRGGPRGRPHPRRRDDPEGDRQERDQTMDGIPPEDSHEEERHRRSGPHRRRFSGGPRSPRQVFRPPDRTVPVFRMAPRPRCDDPRARGGRERGPVPRARGAPAAAR